MLTNTERTELARQLIKNIDSGELSAQELNAIAIAAKNHYET